MRFFVPRAMTAGLCLGFMLATITLARADDLQKIVAQAIAPVMAQYGVPGMAVGLTYRGQNHLFVFGVASKATAQPVTDNTLFEIGSVSKTFTATLASYAAAQGDLSLTDMTSRDAPQLEGSAFDKVSLVELGTHTAGGLPLQVPEDVMSDAQAMSYFKHWKPVYAAGTYRRYSNSSIGLLGVITAQRMHGDFSSLVQDDLFLPLAMTHSFLHLPPSETGFYAQGYTTAGTPIRMAPGGLALEAYGVRTTAGDLLRFVDANMAILPIDPALQRAILATHTGFFRIRPGRMQQDLIWEQYDLPVGLPALMAGNGSQASRDANPATALHPPAAPRQDVLINKTGSTNGFSSYVVFIPQDKLGVVVLANRNFPIPARVKLTSAILMQLDPAAFKN
jgi:beta-lactamase class C